MSWKSSGSTDAGKQRETQSIPDCETVAGCGGNAGAVESTRRKFLQMAVGGTAGLAAGVELISPRRVLAQSSLSADAALKELMDGNERFKAGKLTACSHDLDILKQKTIDKQEPFAAVLSCADSRVPIELVFDQSIGHVFVTRIAGNIATSEIIASLEYGAGVLGTKVIVVMGHSGCGAVKATMQGKEVPGQISALFPHIQRAVDEAGSSLEAATKANAKIQAALLREASTLIAGLVKAGTMRVVAAYYEVGTGAVTILE
ncbi:MAG: carbonic anhydrase [Candidatus Acidiferrum sp.]